MARPQKPRAIGKKPEITVFKPAGIPLKELDEVALTLDEYEAIRLCDYEGLEHAEAAELMEISRPTFTRLIEKARNKTAKAIIEGKALTVEGGKVVIQKRQRCGKCNKEMPHKGHHKCK